MSAEEREKKIAEFDELKKQRELTEEEYYELASIIMKVNITDVKRFFENTPIM